MNYIPKYSIDAQVYATVPGGIWAKSIYNEELEFVRTQDIYLPPVKEGIARIVEYKFWGDKYGFEYGIQFEDESVIRWITPKDIKDK